MNFAGLVATASAITLVLACKHPRPLALQPGLTRVNN
jgi:hypothetical protein